LTFYPDVADRTIADRFWVVIEEVGDLTRIEERKSKKEFGPYIDMDFLYACLDEVWVPNSIRRVS